MAKTNLQNTELLPFPVNESSVKCADSSLIKHQGQKWQQIFDFDSILKQIRTAEKMHLKGKDCASSKTPAPSSSGGFSGKHVSSKSCSQIKQVLRLSGNDMHYYGIVPKTKAENVIVCNVCLGIYTKIGFNNHMMLQHPSVWSSISTKLCVESINDFHNVLPQNFQESVHTTNTAEVTDVKSDTLEEPLPSTMSNSSSLSINYTRHKLSKPASTISVNSVNSSSRSRSKSKHRNSPSSKSFSAVDPAAISTVLNALSKDVSSSLCANITNTEKVQEVTTSSSSSNSSSSYPLTPNLLIKMAESSIDTNNKISRDEKLISSDCSVNQKVKSPTFDTQEFFESPKSNSSSDFCQNSCSTLSSTKPSKSLVCFTTGTKVNNINKKLNASFKPKLGKDQSQYDFRLTNKSDHSLSFLAPNKDIKMKQQYELTSTKASGCSKNILKAQPNFENRTNPQNDALQCDVQSSEIQISENSPLENSILTLEDVLDSKFLNEILNTADPEMHFNENELHSATQQTYLPPANKKMRFSEEPELTYQQTLQVCQQQSNEKEIKIFNEDTSSLVESPNKTEINNIVQQEGQIIEIESNHFQQILYPQNLHTYDGSKFEGNSIFHQTQAFNNSNSSKSKFLDASFDEEQKKNNNLNTNKYSDFSTVASFSTEYEENTSDTIASHFQIFTIPSLTDDITEEMILPSIINNARSNQHYILQTAEDHLVYEITANNQVAVLNQQKQQQVITEFLNQAGYKNIEHLNKNSLTETAEPKYHKFLDENKELFDNNFTGVDKITSLQILSNYNIINPLVIKDKKKIDFEENGSGINKYVEEYFLDVYMYSGLPRPLIINSFGLVKYPQTTATTSRKNLLSRKANNTPIALNGGINGVVGSSTTASIFSNLNTKSMPHILPSISNCGNGSLGNEFSIGSITITSPSAVSQHQNYLLPKQNNFGQMEIILNGTTNAAVAIPGGVPVQRNRFKGNANFYTHNGNSNTVSKNRMIQSTSLSNAAMSQNNNAFRVKSLPQNLKTICVSSTMNSIERIKFPKRNFATKHEFCKKSNFSPKILSEMMSGSNKGIARKSNEKNSSNLETEEQQLKFARVLRFNKRRKQILANEIQEQLRQQHQKLGSKLIHKTNFGYPFSNKTHMSRFNNTSTDIMRIFV